MARIRGRPQVSSSHTGEQPFNNSFVRYLSRWIYYNLNPTVSGQWTLELLVNDTVMVEAPFTVLDPGEVPTNRPPAAVTAAFDPPAPGTNDVIFCRLTVPLIEDPDYDLVSYRYQWSVDGQSLRDVTNAAFADAIPYGLASPGSLLSCTITPFDGQGFGPPTTIQVTMPGGVPDPVTLLVTRDGVGQVLLHWPAAQFVYRLESTATPEVSNSWNPVGSTPSTNGSEWVVSLPISPSRSFFRLRWP